MVLDFRGNLHYRDNIVLVDREVTMTVNYPPEIKTLLEAAESYREVWEDDYSSYKDLLKAKQILVETALRIALERHDEQDAKKQS